MCARMMENEQVSTLHECYADAIGEQCVEEIFGQLAHRTIEKAYQVVAGMEPIQALVLLHQQSVAQAVLLAEYYGLGQRPQSPIHLCVGDVALA
jgi:hypothetical protein